MLKKINKIGFLYRGLSVQLLAVLIADLDGRLLIVLSLWLGSVVEKRILNFDLVSQGLFFFSRGLVFLLVNNGEKFEESVFDLRICLTER